MDDSFEQRLQRVTSDIERQAPIGAIAWLATCAAETSSKSLVANRAVGAAEFDLCVTWTKRLEPPQRLSVLNWVAAVGPEWARPWWELVRDVVQEPQPSRLGYSSTPRSQGSVNDGLDVETWFASSRPQLRRSLGIYHTPDRLVDHVWQRLDPQVWSQPESGELLDPAAGTGAFLAGALRATAATRREGAERIAALDDVLHRMVGVEITLASWLVGLLRIATTLQHLGHDLIPRRELRWWWSDATRTSPDDGCRIADLQQQDFRWIVGNPPYSSRVERSHPRIERLLRGKVDGCGGAIDYHRFRGEPLRERKTWLHDLYVRFYRLSQWWTARSDRATVAFISNRGWLDHKTFRGMREALAADFATIGIDEPIAGENWFDVTTPICLTILRRNRRPSAAAGAPEVSIEQRRIRFPVESTNEEITESQAAIEIEQRITTPREPWFEFASSADPIDDELSSCGWSLTQIFHEHGSAIVTARDALVIAPRRSQLIGRLREMLDPTMDDRVLRARYFRKSRSRRFESGDTRGWKLPAIRERLRARLVDDGRSWRHRLHRCRYRALDDRWIVWDTDLVDWPRFDSQATLADGDWGLIARRQSPIARPADYVLVTDRLVVDGVLRSDNRGNESVFTLHRRSTAGESDESEARRTSRVVPGASRSSWASNLTDVWCRAFAATTREASGGEPSGDGDLERRSFAYLYAVLRTPGFRLRFHDSLVRDFPQVPLIADKAFVDTMADLGLQLIALHCDRPSRPEPPIGSLPEAFRCHQTEGGDSYLSEDERRTCELWTIGAHSPAQRWLRGRGLDGRAMTVEDSGDEGPSTVMRRRYFRLLKTIRETIALEKELDRVVDRFGGWDQLCRVVFPSPKSTSGDQAS